MKRTFCDCCNTEITESNDPKDVRSVSVIVGKFNVALTNTLPSVPPYQGELNPSVDVCKYCLIDAVNNQDDRPTNIQGVPAIKMLDDSALVNLARRLGGSAAGVRDIIKTFCVFNNIILDESTS